MSAIGRVWCVFCRYPALKTSRFHPAAHLCCEAQSRSVMLHHQDQPVNSAYGGADSGSSSSSLRNRKCEKDGNFNFLSGKDDDGFSGGGRGGGGDENRNQMRPRNLGPLGRDPSSSSPSSGFLSPRSRLPCWSPLEPLPEIESGDDGYGRVPPDGAEEHRMEEEEVSGSMRAAMFHDEEEEEEEEEEKNQRKKSCFRGKEMAEDDEWGDSDSESEFSLHSGGSASSLNLESGSEAALMGGWDRIGVGEPRLSLGEPLLSPRNADRNSAARRSFGRKSLSGSMLGNLMEEGPEETGDRSSDSDGELMDAVWTLRDRERFKAQEMEKHQVQLTMYRRLALIRWVRTLQGRVQEQQNRLQSSFDVILTHRKELLRMGAAATTAAPLAAAAVGQS